MYFDNGITSVRICGCYTTAISGEMYYMRKLFVQICHWKDILVTITRLPVDNPIQNGTLFKHMVSTKHQILWGYMCTSLH